MNMMPNLDELAKDAYMAAARLAMYVRVTFPEYPSDSNEPQAPICNQIIRDTDMLMKQAEGIQGTIERFISEWGADPLALLEGGDDDAPER